ncbi:MAG: hypothetical protein EXR62_12805 [Chloroflexi bacterium]|nr:hypothetical protein [Chloroflexota bacterium]
MAGISPLEEFLFTYVETAGGLWEEIEPQVYDVLLPDAGQPLRLAFDPEALPEHPGAQLLTFGNPLLDQMLEKAQARGLAALAFLGDVHLAPYGLEQQVQRDLTLPEGWALQVESVDPRHVGHTLFWFEATYVSDEKEQDVYSVGLDRYYGRLVRYLEPLLAGERLSEVRLWPYPDAPAMPLERAYLLAQERVIRNVTATAHSLKHEMEARLAVQTEQMVRYFADLREEFLERVKKAAARGDDSASLHLRLEALDREEKLRLEEIRHNALLRVQLKLINMLHVKIPRLFLRARLVPTKVGEARVATPSTLIPLNLTWDPVVGKTDAIDCPNCKHPTYILMLNRRGELRCPVCSDDPRLKEHR